MMLDYKYYFPALISLGVALLLVLVILSVANTIFQNQRKLKKDQVELDKLSEQVVNLERLKTGQLAAMKQQVFLALPSEKPLFQALELISDIAEENNVTISTLSSNPGEIGTASAQLASSSRSSGGKSDSTGQAEKLKVTLSVEAEMAALKSFFGQFLQILPLVDLEALRITSISASDSGQDSFSGEMDLMIYYLDDSQIKLQVSEVKPLDDKQTEWFEQLSTFRTSKPTP